MKLLYSTTSPYVRKVRMFILYAGLQNDIEESLVNPFESSDLKDTNPLGKIPVLIDGDLTLYESGLICEYLDERYVAKGNSSLFLKNTPDYFPVQMLHVKANGIIDAAVATLLENRRVDAEQSRSMLDKWYGIIRRSIETLDASNLMPAEHANIGTLSLAAALGYLDFRFDEYGWRNWNKDLEVWFADFDQFSWFTDTKPFI